MKKIILFIFTLSLFASFTVKSQSVVTTTVNYTGFLACGGCNVCGGDYYCFNTPGSYCGNTPPCGTKFFIDPVPAGNIVTNIQVTYFSANCNGNSLSATINGNSVPSVNEGNTGCLCSASPCGASGVTSCNYLSSGGMPNYNYGGTNTLVLCTGSDVCINRIVLTITYVSPGAVNPLITPSGPTTFCQGGNVTLTADPGYASYSWNTGATTQAITVSTSGTYIVNVLTAAGCSASGSIIVTVDPTPAVAVTSNTTICNGSSATLNSTVNPTGGTYNWTPGNLSSSSIVVSPGSTQAYNLQYTSPAGCVNNAAVTVNVAPIPVVSVSTNSSNICNGQSATLSSTVNPTGGTYAWSPGGGSSSTFVVSPTSNQSYTLLYTTTNGCQNSAVVSVNVSPVPVVSVSSNTSAICSGQSATLSSTVNPTGGTYNWTPGNLGSSSIVVSPASTQAYNLQYTSPAGCVNSAGLTLNVNPTPAVSASASSPTICSGQSTTLSSTVTPAGGTYNWSPGGSTSSGFVDSPTSNQTYTVIYTTAAGCPASATTAVNVSSSATVAVSVSNPTICSGSSSTLSSTVAPTGGSYTWTPGGANSSNITVSPTSSQNYTLTYTTPSGCNATATGSVTVFIPSIAVTNTAICFGQTTTLGSTVSPVGGTYNWSPGGISTPTISVSPTVTSTYTLDYMSPDGCTNTAVANVTVNPLPVVSINDATICPGANATLTSTVNPTGGTYAWSPGGQTGSSIVVSPTATSVYTLAYTTVVGCVSSNTAQVTLSPSPTIAVNNVTICTGGGAFALLTPTILPSSVGTYSWSDGSTTSTISVQPTITTVYTVMFTSTAGCTSSQSATVSVMQGFSTADFTFSNNVCFDAQPVVLTATVTSGGGTNSFNWALGASNTPSSATTSTVGVTFSYPGVKTVTLYVSNSFGCLDTIVHQLNINTSPTMNFFTGPVCISSAASFTNNSWISGNAVIASWLWDFGDGNTSGAFQPTHTYTAAGTYTVMLLATADNGCADTLYKTIDIAPLTVPGSVQSSTTVCAAGNTGTLSLIGGNGSVLYWETSVNGGVNWSPLSNTTTTQAYANLTQTSVYQAFVKSGMCPGATAGAATISVLPASDAGILKEDTVVCSAINAGTLSLSSYTGTINDWLFSTNGSTWTPLTNTLSTYSFTNLPTTGLFEAVVQNGICPADTSNKVKVTVFNFAGATVTPSPDTTISMGYSVQLVASGGNQFSWLPNYNISDTTIANPEVWPIKNTTYTVIVQNVYGCRDTAQVTVYVDADYKVIIANTMSPNGDNINDTWWVGNIENYPNNEVMIFNRYGQMLYQTTNYKNTWDGMYNGQKLPDGTYYFVLKFPESNKIYKGSINIINSR